jgi:RNA polymerase sigma factor (sigma-70 family)
MPHLIPPELVNLLEAPEGPGQNDAWAAFVERHSQLLLHVARSYGGDHDAVMDRYAFFLDKLRENDLHRLRTWAADRRSKLTTWLVIVAQRLSLDESRRRYGRPRSDGIASVEARRTRRRLADLLVVEVDQQQAEPATQSRDDPPDTAVRQAELAEILARCVAELDIRDQLLLTLRFEDGLSGAEIAPIMMLPSPFHVYRQLDRLLGQLRQTLRKRGVEDPVP